MGQFVKERFLARDNQEHYANEFERIFGRKCDCYKYEDTACDICQKITGKEKDKDDNAAQD